MTDQRAICLGYEGHRELPGPAQGVDDVLLGVTGVRRMEERGSGQRG